MDIAAELVARCGEEAWRTSLWRYPGWSDKDPDFLRPRPLGEEVVLDSPNADGEKVVLLGQGDDYPAFPLPASFESSQLREGADHETLRKKYDKCMHIWCQSEARAQLRGQLERDGPERRDSLTQALCLGISSFTRRNPDISVQNELIKLAAFLDTTTYLAEQQSSPIVQMVAGFRYTSIDIAFLTSMDVGVVHCLPDETLAYVMYDLTKRLAFLAPSSFVLDTGIEEQDELADIVMKAGVALAILPLASENNFKTLLAGAQGVDDAPYKHSITWQKLLQHPQENGWPEYDGYGLPDLRSKNGRQMSLFIKQSQLFAKQSQKVTTSATASDLERLAIEKLVAIFRWAQKAWAENDSRRDLHRLVKCLEPVRGWNINQAITLATGSFSLRDDDARRCSSGFIQLAAFLDVAQELCGVTKSMRLIAQDPVYTHLDLLFLRELGIEAFRGGVPGSQLRDAVGLITADTLVCEWYIGPAKSYLEQLAHAQPRLVIATQIQSAMERVDDFIDGYEWNYGEIGPEAMAELMELVPKDLSDLGAVARFLGHDVFDEEYLRVSEEAYQLYFKHPWLVDEEETSEVSGLDVCVPRTAYSGFVNSVGLYCWTRPVDWAASLADSWRSLWTVRAAGEVNGVGKDWEAAAGDPENEG